MPRRRIGNTPSLPIRQKQNRKPKKTATTTKTRSRPAARVFHRKLGCNRPTFRPQARRRANAGATRRMDALRRRQPSDDAVDDRRSPRHRQQRAARQIKNTLAEAYGLPLKLQTEPWRDDAGWETPTMRRQRLQLEGRQQAQDLLEADETARQVLKVSKPNGSPILWNWRSRPE